MGRWIGVLGAVALCACGSATNGDDSDFGADDGTDTGTGSGSGSDVSRDNLLVSFRADRLVVATVRDAPSPARAKSNHAPARV